jgi:hypothetical protein
VAGPAEPQQDELLRLHTQLCAGEDPTASARLAELLLPALRRRFRSTRAADPHTIDSLINLSIARYLRDPGRYEPARGPLLAFLYRDVEGDRKNELASLASRRAHELPDSEAVDVASAGRNPGTEEEVLDALDPFDVPREMLEAARSEAATLSEQDRRLLMLIGDGVRETVAYAEILGIAHLPTEVQRREVKRHKDRLKARVEVIRGRLRL